MNTHTYPGKGLTLPQLVFALNEELRRTAHSPSITLEAISRLDQEASTALATIRGWRNSFAHINRIPTDVLSLIPLHLASQGDRLRVTFVCRHWRRTFLQYGALWSQLFLGKGKVYTQTLLERAKGTELDVIASIPVDALTLLSPHVRQIKHLEFLGILWRDIIEFSRDNSEPLSLLRTLKLTPAEPFGIVGPPPSIPLFTNAINLERFVFNSSAVRRLNYFVFPSLTTFELISLSMGGFDVAMLLDFLKASPMLQTVQMRISGDIELGNIPPELVIVLPHVNTFFLVVENGTGLHDIAAHISCPRAMHISLHDEIDSDSMTPVLQIFPTSVSWSPIIQQHTRGPVEEVTLEMRPAHDPVVRCSLNFSSSDKSVITLCCEVSNADADGEGFETNPEEIRCEVFCQALRTICNHPLASNIKLLQISSMGVITELDDDYLGPLGDEFGRLFESLGSLDTLSIDGYDPRLYLAPFLNLPELSCVLGCRAYPPIKELKISHPTILHNQEECREAVIELAKSQHARGTPFERVTIDMQGLPTAMVEKLKPWVGVVSGG